ncbi:MAG: TauD/TfdA family dioxygenase [Alphaproteobacteria bacterium]|nr:TauD/TfdA family dioxygenase [Alphaproteobacteria bacterium]
MASAILDRIEVTPLSPVMGAEVRGIDLARPLDDAAFKHVRDTFYRHMLLRFPDQRISPEQHVAFSRRFGPLQVHVLDQFRHPEHPEIYVLSNVDKATGGTTGRHPDRGTLVWHSDLSFQRRPALATILHGIEVPAQGGDTLFANMAAAYDALPDAAKRRIAPLRAVHDLDYSRTRAGEPPMTAAQRQEAPPVDHPMVRTHPGTGAKSLYISHHIREIVGLPQAEGRALFEELMAHATQDRFVFRQSWTEGDVVMWDNRCTMHKATEYDAAGQRRTVQRTVVIGDVPV